ncbi:MAG: YjbQ family protein [Verrucomicrobia bacterium]|nr:MAG: YjbQ family protein [Verrucomicrobiota bacterium]
MKAHHTHLQIRTAGRGTYEITDQLLEAIRSSGIQDGLATVFCRHTSCSLVIMENADPSARHDLEAYFNRIAPDGDPAYLHSAEGPDDMSAHLRMALTRTSETIPVIDGRPALGTWQGLFLFEHRTAPHRRSIVITVLG